MFSSGLVLTALLLMSVSIGAFDRAQSYFASRNGTLIVVIRATKGVLGCADRRTHSSGTDSDNYLKIRRIKSNGFFVTSGVLAITASDAATPATTLSTVFDANELIEAFVNDDHNTLTDGVKFWDTLRQTIALELSKVEGKPLPDVAGPKLILSPFLVALLGDQITEPHLLLHSRFFYLDGQRTIVTTELTCVFDEATKRTSVKTACWVGKAKQLKDTPIVSLSVTSDEFFNELRSGTESRFDALRHDIRLKPFLADDIPIPSLDRAQEFARLLISLTSEHGPLIHSDVRVSSTCDCAVLDYNGKFMWLREPD